MPKGPRGENRPQIDKQPRIVAVWLGRDTSRRGRLGRLKNNGIIEFFTQVAADVIGHRLAVNEHSQSRTAAADRTNRHQRRWLRPRQLLACPRRFRPASEPVIQPGFAPSSSSALSENLIMSCDLLGRNYRILARPVPGFGPRGVGLMRHIRKLRARQVPVSLKNRSYQAAGIGSQFLRITITRDRPVHRGRSMMPDAKIQRWHNRAICPRLRRLADKRLVAICQPPAVRDINELDELQWRKWLRRHLLTGEAQNFVGNLDGAVRHRLLSLPRDCLPRWRFFVAISTRRWTIGSQSHQRKGCRVGGIRRPQFQTETLPPGAGLPGRAHLASVQDGYQRLYGGCPFG